MPDSTPAKKAITIQEILSDVPQALMLFTTVNEKLLSPPSPTTAAGWVEALGFPSGLVHTAAAAFDDLKKGPVTFTEVATLLGIDASGVVGQAGALGAVVYTQSQN